MDATAVVHPTDQTLHSYAMGKLDSARSRSVSKHLESCSACRRRVAEMSSDSYLDRIGDAQTRPESPAPVVPADDRLSMLDTGSSSPAPLVGRIANPSHESLPPGLAGHPDYEVIRELGQGGMGTVYLALNRLMGRHEVLKVVSSHLVRRRGALDRFLGEIRNAARLHHTNIVTAYSAMRFGECIIFAMEYVEGLDLAKLVNAKGPLPVAKACNYAHQAALGLEHAHEMGMVHRDIKPSNLMLSPQGSRAVIKVLDFGLAKIHSEGAFDGGLTHEGQMLGTPEYIAPEQIGDARRADIRADIYSLGCTLYYLLTGGPPFKATSLYEILQAHHSMDALPLYLARPDVPAELAALVARMMAKAPEQRFQAPNEVAQALKPFFKTGGAWSGAPKVELCCPGLDDPVSDTRAQAPDAVPRSAPTKPGPVTATKQVPVPARAETFFEGLIDVGEPEALTDASPVIASRMPRIARAHWPIIIAVSVAVAAMLGGGVVYVTRNTDERGTVVQGREAGGPRAESPVAPAVVSEHEAAHVAAADFPSKSFRNEDSSDRVPFSTRAHDHGDGRVPPSVVERSVPATASRPAPQIDEHAAEKRLLKRQQREAGSATPVVRDLTPAERLQKLGLERLDKSYVLSQEADLVRKYNSTRSLVDEHLARMEKRTGIEMAIAQMKQLEHENNERNLLIDQRNQVLERQPARPNSDQKAQFAMIKAERDELVRLRSEATFEWKELRSQFPSQREIHELDVAIERGRSSCRSALADLRAAFESADVKFAELTKNEQVRTALSDIGGVKLGHTKGYEKVGKQIKQWEAIVQSTDETKRPRAERVPKKKNSGMRKR